MVDHGNAGSRVIQQELVVGGAQQRVDGDRHGTDFYCTEKTVSKFGSVRKQEQEALFHARAKFFAKCVAEAVDVVVELRIRDALVSAFNGDAVPAGFSDVAVDEVG